MSRRQIRLRLRQRKRVPFAEDFPFGAKPKRLFKQRPAPRLGMTTEA